MTDVGGGVDFARGHRSYINAVDMIIAAPISVGDDSFRFRFFNFCRAPGCWLSADAGGTKAHGKAELMVERSGRRQAFYFICEDERAPLRRVPDFDFRFDPAPYRLTERRLSGPLRQDVSIWQQVTEAVRFGGARIFPGSDWVLVGIAGTGPCLGPITKDAELHIDLLDHREQINVLRFHTSAGGQGRIMTAPRPPDAR